MNNRFRSRIILMMIICFLVIAIQSLDGRIITDDNLSVKLTPQLEEVAHIENTGGDSFQAIAEEDILIVMDMNSGINFYNISDPASPTFMSSYDDGGIPHQMHKIGDLLYLADHYDGLEIYNVSNPFAITQLGSITDDGDGEIDGVFVIDELAYVAEWHDSSWDWSLKIINVTDPTTPVEITEYTDGDNEFVRFYVRDDICFTSCLGSGFKILNVTDPENIDEITTFSNVAYAWEFQLISNTVYLSDGIGLQILDVSTLDAPTKLGDYTTTDNCFGVEVKDDIAYIAVDETGLKILNISDPQNIVKLADFSTEDITNVEVHNDLIFLTMHEFGLKILQVTWIPGTIDASFPLYSIALVLPILLFINKKQRRK